MGKFPKFHFWIHLNPNAIRSGLYLALAAMFNVIAFGTVLAPCSGCRWSRVGANGRTSAECFFWGTDLLIQHIVPLGTSGKGNRRDCGEEVYLLGLPLGILKSASH